METINTFKKLSAYFIEFLLLFLAVTLGFFAENYREGLVERKTEKMYLQSLSKELGQDTLKMDYSLQSKKNKDQYFDSLYAILYQTPGPWPTRKLYYISRYLLIREHFYGTEGTIHQLENAGGFKLIQNEALVEKINAYTAAKEKLYQIQLARDQNAIPFKEAIGKVFYGKELAFLFDSTKFKGMPYSMGEPNWDPPLKGNEEDLDQFFYWASNEIFIERNCAVLLQNLRIAAKELIFELELELSHEND
ncbi:MAG: hypothetical protein NBV57_01240 [Algoriphagus sp.]|nr:hypothetical protein [Algoriphagus sp.]